MGIVVNKGGEIPSLGFEVPDWLGGVLGSSGGSAPSGGSSSAGAGSVVGAGLGLALGPWSGVVDGVIGFLGNLLGGIGQEGWSLSCIGAQAFNKNDFAAFMAELQTKMDAVTGSNFNQVGSFLNYCSYNIVESDLEIARYASSCSKTLRTKYKEACQAAIDNILPNYQYSTKMLNATDYKGTSYMWTSYTVTALNAGGSFPGGSVGGPGGSTSVPGNTGVAGGGSVFIPGIGIVGGSSGGAMPNGYDPGSYVDQEQGLMNAFSGLTLPDQVLLQGYASQNGMTLLDVLGSYFSGQLKIENGRVIWSVSAGNDQSSGIMNYILYGGAAFLVYKLIKK